MRSIKVVLKLLKRKLLRNSELAAVVVVGSLYLYGYLI